MQTYLEEAITYEDWLKDEATNRFPSLDMDWAVNQVLKRVVKAQRRNAEIAARMALALFRWEGKG